MQKTNPDKKRKLVLETQTVRELTSEELGEVAGGTSISCGAIWFAASMVVSIILVRTK
jgi:hypothetical protein